LVDRSKARPPRRSVASPQALRPGRTRARQPAGFGDRGAASPYHLVDRSKARPPRSLGRSVARPTARQPARKPASPQVLGTAAPAAPTAAGFNGPVARRLWRPGGEQGLAAVTSAGPLSSERQRNQRWRGPDFLSSYGAGRRCRRNRDWVPCDFPSVGGSRDRGRRTMAFEPYVPRPKL
jgi:hypothetical protein